MGHTYTKQLFIIHQKFNWACCILSAILTLEGSDWGAGNRGRWSSCGTVSTPPPMMAALSEGLWWEEGVRKRLETERVSEESRDPGGSKLWGCGGEQGAPESQGKVPLSAHRPQVGNLSRTIEKINGVARCPYDPRHNSTAVISSQGELYAATVIDFSGRDPAIYRSLGSGPPLRTAQYNSKWLNGKGAQSQGRGFACQPVHPDPYQSSFLPNI